MERVAIVGIRRPRQAAEQFHSLMEELNRLIETAGRVVEQ